MKNDYYEHDEYKREVAQLKARGDKVLYAQEGPQSKFLSTTADICLYGGAAGGGKTFGLLLKPLQYKHIQGFGCTIFRKTHVQIFNQGGLWDESINVYSGIPGAVPRTSTIALTNATLQYGLQIADKGLEKAALDNPAIASGINTYDGKLTCKNVADSFEGYEYTQIESVLQ